MAQKNDKIEQKAIKLLIDHRKEGLLQSELWKLLDISSREGSRIAKKFEEQNKVTREKVLHDGRWTFRLFIKNKPITLNSVAGCPCLICPEVEKCFIGGKKDPTVCIDLTAWIDPRIASPIEKTTQQDMEEKTSE